MKKSRFLIGYAGLLAFLLAMGCGKRNPAFQPDSGNTDGVVTPQPDGPIGPLPDGPIGPLPDLPIIPPPDGQPIKYDKGPGIDGPVVVKDSSPTSDTVIWPDAMPWKCVTNGDCNDNKACTTDICDTTKQCKNTLQPGYCLINGKCYKKGDKEPGNDCSVCDPLTSTTAWATRADGLTCNDDKLTCTTDVCKGGKCVHNPTAGNCAIAGVCYKDKVDNVKNTCQVCDVTKSQTAWTTKQDNAPCAMDGLTCTKDICLKAKCEHPLSSGCLVNNKCIPELGSDSSNPCKVCVPSISKTALTDADGMDCSTSSGPKICLGTKCRPFTSTIWEPSGASSTVLRGVSHIPAASKVYAAGEYNSGGAKGLILDVATAGGTNPSVTTVAQPLRDIDYRLAVGTSGAAYLYASAKWTAAASITSGVANTTRDGVWGNKVGSVDTFFLTGQQTSTASGIYRCVEQTGGTFLCSADTGEENNRILGPIFGTLTSTGGLGPLWSGVIGSNQPEDIYYNDGKTTAWTTKGPHGCDDSGGTPCSNTNTVTYNIGGSSSSDVWMVGSGGMILRYDGTKWVRISNAFSSQNYYTIHSVWSSPKEKVTFFAASYNTWGSSGHRVRIFTYNHALKRWFGPTTLRYSQSNSPDYIHDLGGTDLNNFWGVGQIRHGSGSSTRTKAWVIHLQ